MSKVMRSGKPAARPIACAPTTPVAAIESATTDAQVVGRWTLAELADADVRSPSVIVIGAVAAFDSVIAFAAPERIVANAADDRIATGRATNRDVIATGILNNATRVAYDNIRRQTRCVANDQVN